MYSLKSNVIISLSANRPDLLENLLSLFNVNPLDPNNKPTNDFQSFDREFDVALWTIVRSYVTDVMTFITDNSGFSGGFQGQSRNISKFVNLADSFCECYMKIPLSLKKQLEFQLYSCYVKFARLLNSNSVLYQHFGYIGELKDECEFFEVGNHRICMKHCSDQYSRIYFPGSFTTMSDLYTSSFNIPLSSEEFYMFPDPVKEFIYTQVKDPARFRVLPQSINLERVKHGKRVDSYVYSDRKTSYTNLPYVKIRAVKKSSSGSE